MNNLILYKGGSTFLLLQNVLSEPSEKEFSGDQWKEYDAHINHAFHMQERE